MARLDRSDRTDSPRVGGASVPQESCVKRDRKKNATEIHPARTDEMYLLLDIAEEY